MSTAACPPDCRETHARSAICPGRGRAAWEMFTNGSEIQLVRGRTKLPPVYLTARPTHECRAVCVHAAFCAAVTYQCSFSANCPMFRLLVTAAPL
jgi:hypothetical protein